jgi:Fe2+ transport system protein B
MSETLEDRVKLIESLLESATDYGKTSYDLIKLKTLDKTSDVLSTVIPHSVVAIIIVLFTLFFNLGLAFWLGEILGNAFYGFFVVAAFYGIAALVIHLFLHRWLKQKMYNYVVKQLFK